MILRNGIPTSKSVAQNIDQPDGAETREAAVSGRFCYMTAFGSRSLLADGVGMGREKPFLHAESPATARMQRSRPGSGRSLMSSEAVICVGTGFAPSPRVAKMV